jgi:nicotinate-nucleotide adenylyltransferase
MPVAADKIAILGGTFNPVHVGHLHIANEAHEKLGYSLILFIPSSIPVHKPRDVDTQPEHRVAMLRLALKNLPHATIDECEIQRGGPSYSIDTVTYIYGAYRFEGKPGLIIGDDLVGGFNAWRRVEDLVEMVDLIVAKRTSTAELDLPYRHRYLANDIQVASSSHIRMLVREGKHFESYLPSEVSRYIQEHGLYRGRIH